MEKIPYKGFDSYLEYKKDRIEKDKIKYKKEYAKNKHKNVARSKKYREENRELLRKKQKLYRKKNPDKVRVMNKEWHEKNRERAREHNKRSYQRNNVWHQLARIKRSFAGGDIGLDEYIRLLHELVVRVDEKSKKPPRSRNSEKPN
jgi:predicted glycosyltransferase involved in capsule biosynthesis